jgi:H+/gluconate symporter-like permease
MASGCMDSLPHNGAVISLLAICKLTHRESYRYIFVNTVAFPMLALTVVIALGSLFGNF